MKVKLQKPYFLKSYMFLLCIVLIISCNSTKVLQPSKTTSKTTAIEVGQKTLQSQFNQGVDFYAAGHNGEWELNLDFEQDFAFKRADGFKFNTPAVEGIKAQDANVVRYRAAVESGEMIVEVYKQECTNSGTEKKSPYKVIVEIKRGIDKDYNQVEGCGRFVFDERIHDIWVLQQLNNKTVSGNDLPYIEFNTTNGTALGNTGCNNFSGKADFKANIMTIGRLTTTRKFCPNAVYESEFLKAMATDEMKYKIDNGKLFLTSNGKDTIVFKKVD